MKAGIDPVWRKSSFCESNGCVEVAVAEHEVELRDSANPRVVVKIPRADWDIFVQGVRAGDFD